MIFQELICCCFKLWEKTHEVTMGGSGSSGSSPVQKMLSDGEESTWKSSLLNPEAASHAELVGSGRCGCDKQYGGCGNSVLPHHDEEVSM
ncbi:hypothetical protein MLD38_002163 [Melastoma candidum]|uniref:Uncharacterized protein n=1 Tax=Melastoma candidum TaxID=119954 RepID=A0ACB9SJJ6_9MYRT|nr:hypothetical protein MLD38_002163 [Melastoma candidum]